MNVKNLRPPEFIPGCYVSCDDITCPTVALRGVLDIPANDRVHWSGRNAFRGQIEWNGQKR
jgi:hypothetical protein